MARFLCLILCYAAFITSAPGAATAQAFAPSSVSLPDLRWPAPKLFIGIAETHGTQEVPLLVETLASKLVADGYVVHLMLEMPERALAFAKAPTLREAANELSASEWWGKTMQDGRSGTGTACTIWRLRTKAPSVQLHGVDQDAFTSDREAFMAREVVRNASSSGADLVAVIYWAGNLHVLSMPGRPLNTFTQASEALEGFSALTVEVAARGGSAYNCQRDVCAPHVMTPNPQARLGLSRFSPTEWMYAFEAFSPQLPVSEDARSPEGVLKACEQ